MKLLLLVVGKTKTAEIKSLIADYSARIAKMMPFEIQFVPEYKINQVSLIPQALKAEAENLQKKIPAASLVIALDEHGKQHTSISFSKKLNQYFNGGHKQIVWIIGGAWGLDPQFKQRAAETLALSSMTLAHELAQVVFVEQLYRALSILKGLPYHHE